MHSAAFRACENTTSVASGVGAQVSLTSGWAVGQHRVLPVILVEKGRSPLLPTVGPVAGSTGLCLRGGVCPRVALARKASTRILCGPLGCCGAQLTQAPFRRLLLTQSPHHLFSHLRCSLADHVKSITPGPPNTRQERNSRRNAAPDLPSASGALPTDDSHPPPLLGTRPTEL